MCKLLDDALLMAVIEKSPEGIIITDCNYSLVYLNNAASKIFKIQKETNIKDIFSVEEIDLNSKNIQKINHGDNTLSIKIEKINYNNIKLIIFYIKDITTQVEQEEKLYCLDALIDSINDGVIVCDSKGHVVVYNKQIAKIEGRDKSDVLGKHYFDVWCLPPEESFFYSVFETGKPRLNEGWNYRLKTGREVNYIHSNYPVLKDNEVIGVYCICKDVSQIRKLLTETIELREKKISSGDKENLCNGTRYTFKDIIGESEAIKTTISQGIKAAHSLAPIMVYGETGTGKELFVQSIHNASLNNKEPFIAINCAAIPENLLESILFGTTRGAFTGAENKEGLFEQAGKGTLFLDEINSMPLTLQAKLLRVIQERTVRRLGGTEELPVYCRIISSTNVDPWKCIKDGTMRQDLFYRLAGIYLELPPLRERKGDIKVLTEFFLNKYAKIYGKGKIKLSEQLLEFFEQKKWPGNVRELEHVIESTVSMLDSYNVLLKIEHLPSYLRLRMNKIDDQSLSKNMSGGLVERMENIEKKIILDALEKNKWNITHTANSLKIKRQTLHYKIKKLNIRNIKDVAQYNESINKNKEITRNFGGIS